MGYPIRSLAEVVTCLFKAQRRNYINHETFDKLNKESHHLMNMMHSFKKKINKQHRSLPIGQSANPARFKRASAFG